MTIVDMLFNGAQKFTQQISSQIADRSPQGSSQEEFLTTVIAEFKTNPHRLYMDVAQRYYENKNDILEARRHFIGKDCDNNPVLMESKLLANNKLTHNFMKKLTRQKIGYMLGKPFDLTTIKEDDEQAKLMFEALKPYFDFDFYKMIKNVGRDSIIKGIGWLMAYYNEEGQLRFKRCNSEEVIPFWKDEDHTVLNAVVRTYTVEQYTGGNKKKIDYVEYYTLDGVYYYVYDDHGKLIPDNSVTMNPDTHFHVAAEDTILGTNWTRIPFIPFKYDPDEQSLLSRIKELIDDYDRKTSDVANDIDDHPNSVTVVKNYDGTSKEEFVHNKNHFRTIFVHGDGDASSLDTPLNVKDVDIHIQRLREDIYEFGQGVNTADKDIRDTSGVALRFMYADLDMDCIDWGGEVEWSLMQVIWFIQQDMKARGQDFTSVQYGIIFNTDMIVNETETIENCMRSVGTISGETIAENHPWTRDFKKEIAAMRGEQEETLKLEQQYGEEIGSGLSGQRLNAGQNVG